MSVLDLGDGEAGFTELDDVMRALDEKAVAALTGRINIAERLNQTRRDAMRALDEKAAAAFE